VPNDDRIVEYFKTIAEGVNIPIVPGIISILSAPQIKRFTALCGSKNHNRKTEKERNANNH